MAMQVTIIFWVIQVMTRSMVMMAMTHSYGGAGNDTLNGGAW
jgi:hypothetical protein